LQDKPARCQKLIFVKVDKNIDGFDIMKGVLVFIAVFIIVFLISLGATSLPPGQAIYNKLNLPPGVITYKVAGAIYGDVLIKAIFNGVIYGFIVWLVFTILTRTFRKKKA
jgi:hypothetical protein